MTKHYCTLSLPTSAWQRVSGRVTRVRAVKSSPGDEVVWARRQLGQGAHERGDDPGRRARRPVRRAGRGDLEQHGLQRLEAGSDEPHRAARVAGHGQVLAQHPHLRVRERPFHLKSASLAPLSHRIFFMRFDSLEESVIWNLSGMWNTAKVFTALHVSPPLSCVTTFRVSTHFSLTKLLSFFTKFQKACCKFWIFILERREPLPMALLYSNCLKHKANCSWNQLDQTT